MKIIAFFNLIRWKNLVLIALMQIFIKIFFLNNFGFETTLSNTLFYLLVFSTSIITAAGYIINDIIDLKIDTVNKPNKIIIANDISIFTAKKIYIIFTILGVFIGIFVAVKIKKPLYATFFIEIVALLYLYSKFLKGKILIGNIVVSILLTFSIIIIFIFDYPVKLNSINWNVYFTIKWTLFYYAVCAFLLNFIREIIKDIEDINGDYSAGLKTFPIIFGRNVARNFTIFLSVIVLSFLLIGVVKYINIISIAFIYILTFIFLPLLYFAYKLWNSKSQKDYHFLSNLLKVIILFGVLSIQLISNYLKNVIN